MFQVLDANETHGCGRDWQVQGMTTLMPSMEVQVGTLDQKIRWTWRVLAYMVLLYNGLSRFSSLNGLGVPPVLETCEMVWMGLKNLTPGVVDDCTTKKRPNMRSLWYHKTWATRMSSRMITKAGTTQLSFLFFRSLGGWHCHFWRGECRRDWGHLLHKRLVLSSQLFVHPPFPQVLYSPSAWARFVGWNEGHSAAGRWSSSRDTLGHQLRFASISVFYSLSLSSSTLLWSINRVNCKTKIISR